MQQFKTMVGPGHWFAMPDTYMRIGFGWIDQPTLKTGLKIFPKRLMRVKRSKRPVVFPTADTLPGFRCVAHLYCIALHNTIQLLH